MEIISLFNIHKLHQLINDDILVEIFIRLPDRRSLIRCSVVCKQWFSIINSTYYHKLKLLRDESKYQSFPFTIIFRHGLPYKITTKLYEYSPNYSSSVAVSSSDGGGDGSSYLGFLPWADVRLHSSVEDLLLISRQECQYFVICNPFTRKWIELPQVPLDDDVNLFFYTCYMYAGLVFESNNRRKWRANCDSYDLHTITFCSETGKWSRIFKSLTIPSGLSLHPPLVFNGLLHWHSMDYVNLTVDGNSAFDPFKDPDHPKYFRFITFPLDLDRVADWKSHQVRVRLGLVQGRMRFSQLLITKTSGFVLKVWELKEDGMHWTLVHDVTMKKWTDNRHFVAAFHPNNGNVLFLLHKKQTIYQYNIEEGKKRKVTRLPNDGDESFPFYLCNYVIVNPPLRLTSISALSYL